MNVVNKKCTGQMQKIVEKENLWIVISRCLTPTRHGYFVLWARTLYTGIQTVISEGKCVCVCVFTDHTHTADVCICECLRVPGCSHELFECCLRAVSTTAYPSFSPAVPPLELKKLQRWSVKTFIWILHSKSAVVWFASCCVMVQSRHLTKC